MTQLQLAVRADGAALELAVPIFCALLHITHRRDHVAIDIVLAALPPGERTG